MDWKDLWHPTDRQIEAHKAVKKYKFLLYGGAVGGGKSYFLRWETLYLLLYFFNKYKITDIVAGLFCEDYPSLKDRQLSKIRKEFPLEIGRHHADHKEYGNCFLLNPGYGSGVVAFRNLDDPSKYVSAEFAVVAIDELTKNKKQVFDELRHRLRWPGIPDVKFISGSNPGSIGHGWVKKMWFDGTFEPGEEEAHLFHFVRALATDNPHLDPSYYATLSGLPPDLKAALKDGNWDRFAGQFFNEWDRTIHGECPLIKGQCNEIIGIDYGYEKPSSVGWYKIGIDGKLTRYNELYQTGLTYTMLAKKIIEMTEVDDELKYPINLEYIVADPSIWNDRAHHKDALIGESGAETMQRIFNEAWGVSRIVLVQGDNNRVVGWGRCREYLKPYKDQHDQKTAKFGVTRNCTEFNRSFPDLVFSKTRQGDVDTTGEDHAGDEFRYVVMSRPETPTPPSKHHIPTTEELIRKRVRDSLTKKKEPKIIGM
ncbi:hypothetical protein LCGC14_0399140 [marine sediment metagenome]|uniref:Phage terminase large subunit N-terminal domain-containing protein n=1 Tax=marine sediment metagenome TaxID=412755 RepID=A0A0F9W6C7_9ZZZZ|nr:hypothetical protein [Candidatus Aminicenantes bacterium]